jgi:hypothetical protein
VRCNNSGPAHPLSLDLTIRPMKKDPVRVPSQAGAFWRATSSDPAFIARPPKGTGKLKPGWYVIRTRIVERSGRLAGPRVYIPFPKGGYAESRAVELEHDGEYYRAEVLISDGVDHFRFDPSIYPCEFACDGLSIEELPGHHRRFDTVRDMARVIGRLLAEAAVVWFRLDCRCFRVPWPWGPASGRSPTMPVKVSVGAYPDCEVPDRIARQLLRWPPIGFARPIPSHHAAYNTPEATLRR